MEAEILAPETKEIEEQSSALVEYANALVVDSPERFAEAAAFSKACAATVRRIHEQFDPICEAADKAHKVATKKRGDLLAVPQMARSVADGKATRWFEAQQELLANAEREARDAEQRKLDEERLKLAENAEAVGDTETRDILLDNIGTPSSRPIATPLSVARPPKVAGYSIGTRWGARLKPNGLKELVAAAARDPRLLCYLMPDMMALNRVARAQGSAFSVPGVEVFDTSTTRVTRP